MILSKDDLDSVISSHLRGVGPEYNPDEEKKDWEQWLSRLTGDNIHLIVNSIILFIDRLGSYDTTNAWLRSLLECLVHAGLTDPGLYLQFAEHHKRSGYCAIFIDTAGHIFSDEAIEWLIDLQKEAGLSSDELRLLATAYYELATEAGLHGLMRLASVVKSDDPLRQYIDKLAARLSDAIK